MMRPKIIIGLLLINMFCVGMLPAQNADEWQLSLGKEFPGAQGNVFQSRNNDGVCLEGYFRQGGNYVAMILPFKKPLNFKEILIKLKSADPRQG